MNDFLDRISKLSPKRLALLALELDEKLRAETARQHAPIAIVGLACRFPGESDDPGRFWELLRDGRDAIVDVPANRWDAQAWFDPDPDAPGRMSVRNGGFLRDVDQFEPGFFGISPREAQTMDPQQRLLLEVTWQALERAGIAPEQLAGKSGGVFVGVCNSDYSQRVLGRGVDTIDAYFASGNAHSVAAGRIAYTLGLRGPALAIDTACSSSLVALHAACQSLRSGETTLALCGGVNLMCSPHTTITLSKSHMLAPDGRCKTFDASADGFARGEGCGVLVLKRLEAAVADGDRVLAVIRGTATNQDGRSGGLTVPNGPAQEAVIRAALADAGVDPSQVDYVEAHGTGTSLGDPIEVRALAGVFGPGRDPATPLWIGSVKTNIGHLESAAGIAGVIKVVLSLQHERLPRHLHFREPSPHIPWSEYPVRVPTEGHDWPRSSRARIASVSSFGFSGTNAHVVIEEAPLPEPVKAAATLERPLHCLPLSARTRPALQSIAHELVATLRARPDVTLADVAHTLGVGRSHLAERAAVVADSVDAALGSLRALAGGRPDAQLVQGSVVPGQPAEVVFLYTGQGSQYPGMARALYAAAPVFREVIDRCDAALGADAQGRTLTTVLWSDVAEPPAIHETVWTQPALFAVEYGLTQLWRSWGVEPAAVIGHSVGEYVAACVAGVFSLEDGLRLIAERGRLMQDLPPGGSMAAIFAPAGVVEAAVAPLHDRVAIAAYNAADSVVISGDAAAIDTLLASFAQRNVQGHRLFVSLAAHSPLVAPALDAMQRCAAGVAMKVPQIPVAWNVTGGAPLPGGAPDAIYWRRHLREPVRFADGLAALHRDGFRTFLEVGPHPTLIALAQRSLPEADTAFVTSLRRGKDDWRELTTGLAQLYARGAAVDWRGVDAPYGRQRIVLPTYPFERQSYWISDVATASRGVAVHRSGATAMRPTRLPTAAPIFETLLTPQSPAYLDAHRLRGAVLVAGPVLVELAQQCAVQCHGQAWPVLEQFSIAQPLVLPAEGRLVQVQLDESVPGIVSFTVHSAPVDAPSDWLAHASGRLVQAPFAAQAGEWPRSAGASPMQAVDGAAHYARLAALGVELGDDFRTVCSAQRRDGAAVVSLSMPVKWRSEAVAWAHPVLLDGAMQAAGLALPDDGDDPAVYLLTEVERIELPGPLPPEFLCDVELRPAATPRPAEWRADVEMVASDGRRLGSLRGVVLRRASREALQRLGGVAAADGIHYGLEWQPAVPCLAAAPFLAAPATVAEPLRESFAQRAIENGMRVYEPLLRELDQLSSQHVASALSTLGFDATPGHVFTAASEAVRLGIVPRHARLFARMLDMLAEDGVLARHAQGFEVVAPLPTPEPVDPYESLLARFKPIDGELLTLRRCGPQLAGVLAGRQDPLQLLFPGGSLAEARQLYVESPFARTYNGALAAAIEAAIHALPAGARLRILEIGAGTGGTTTYVLPRLPADRCEYTFTDVSPLFLERAATQFAAYPFMRTGLLDIERDPQSQGFQPGSYDIVIAANVLHATADLRETVRHASSLLAGDGQLLLLEGVAPQRWVDLTFGLTEGWWRFTDNDLRPAYPLVSRDCWGMLLGNLGFVDVCMLPATATFLNGAAQQALMLARKPATPRTITVVGDGSGLAAALASLLRSAGHGVGLVAASHPTGLLAPATDVVYVGALDIGVPEDADAGAMASETLAGDIPLSWMRALAQTRGAGRLWLVTCGAQGVRAPADCTNRWQATLWGLGRGFALEEPGHWGGLIDLDPADGVGRAAAQVLDSLAAIDLEDQVAWRNGQRFCARVTRCVEPAARPVSFRPDATYMITGGFGGLGLLVARWMAERGARHLALAGRNPGTDFESVRAIEAIGARVIPVIADVADAAAMSAAIAELATHAPPLRGLVHAAAALSGASVGSLTSSQLGEMLRPKIRGTVGLEKIGRDLNLDFTVLFSSTTALLGASGLAHYAAANAFLDATAASLDRPGRRVLSVNWGTWDTMRLASAEDRRAYRVGGLEPMPAAEALGALATLLAGTRANAIVARIDWDALKALHEVRRPRPLLARMGNGGPQRATMAPDAPTPRLEQVLAGVPEGRRLDAVVDFVSHEVATVLGLDPSAVVSPEMGLFDLGMDSLMSVELRRRLERGTGRSLPSTLTFNYPNVAALAGFLHQQVQTRLIEGAAAAIDAAALSEPEATTEAVPHAASDLDSLTDDELEARLMARLRDTR